MKQAIIILLKKNPVIELIRKKYVPGYDKYEPHISLVYSFDVSNQDMLIKHIKSSVSDFSPFRLVMKGFEKSKKEYYLYLSVADGLSEILSLYGKLNSGILSGFENKDMPKYIPHMTLGIFDSEKEINSAIEEITSMNISFETIIESVQLITLGENNALMDVNDFLLGKLE